MITEMLRLALLSLLIEYLAFWIVESRQGELGYYKLLIQKEAETATSAGIFLLILKE